MTHTFFVFSSVVKSPLRLAGIALVSLILSGGLFGGAIASLGALGALVLVAPLWLGLLFVVWPRRVTVDATGIHLRPLLRARTLPYSEIRSFEPGRLWRASRGLADVDRGGGLITLRSGEVVPLLVFGMNYTPARAAAEAVSAAIA